ncbi:MAG TPA: DNA polymerase III subunit delta [Candidatus Saccharimonadales bacterium]|nr:DNA polymerase III subunit delta [Candidatus Saccharimonadales bacterium]
MIITLTGENAFGLRGELDGLVAGFVAEQGELGVERLDGETVTFARISEALTSLPFLMSKKLVLISRGSANKQFAEQTQDVLNNLPETTDVILVEPKLDKRSGYYKFLKKSTDFREFNPLDVNGLSRWLVSEAKARGGSLSQRDAQYLVERVGLNQQLLANELEKLLLYEPQVSRESIELLTEPTPQSTVFQLLEAAFAGNGKRAMQLYREQRAQKVEPPQIVAMLAWQLHVLALIKTAGERSGDAVASEAHLSPYVVRKSQAIANKLSYAELKELVRELADIDVRSKREALNVDDALQNYLLKLAL